LIRSTWTRAAGGSGGWPLTVFLTPDQAPFYGGTYFPPKSAYGRPGFGDLLKAVARAYKERRSDIETQGEAVRANLTQTDQLVSGTDTSPDESAVDQAFQSLSRQFDNNHGGFGGAPKFPHHATLVPWLCSPNRFSSRPADGGLFLSGWPAVEFDQLGGGFTLLR
jgi:uncharacterized protein YyaL (SSP411 family)